MKRRVLSLMLALLMLASMMPMVVAANGANAKVDTIGPEYTGNVLVAVNKNYDTEARGAGETFTAAGSRARSNETYQNAAEAEGMEYAELPEIPVQTMRMMLAAEGDRGNQNASYATGDTKSVYSFYIEGNVALECLYIGKHCTVWGQTDCDDKIKINANIAKEIGKEFDGRYDSFGEYFGTEAVDRDGDGKIALFCYDIQDSYNGNKGNIGGYHWSGDLTKNNMDCVHIDTYPKMGRKGNELGNVKNCYSTLFHEYQHFINYSTRLNAQAGSIDTFTNEAMSMAAEHLVCGYESVSDRVSAFNTNVKNMPGRALMYWAEENGSKVNNYGYAYVWGQYLRTRYAQMKNETGADAGASIYREIMSRLGNGKNTIEIAADILYANDTALKTSEQRAQALVRDFWIACLLKESKGIYGFNGETFAQAIDVTGAIQNNVPANSGKIYNGGATYYYINATQMGNVTANSDAIGFAGVCTETVERDIVLLLDYSSSMEDDQIRSLKEASKLFCSQICDGVSTKVSIVTYNERNVVRCPLTADKTTLFSTIDSLPDYSSGLTYMAEALDTADAILSGSSASKQIIVLMTDGQPNGRATNTSNKYADACFSAVYDTANAMVQKYDQVGKDLDIYTLGFYTYANSNAEQLLSDMAAIPNNDGSYQKVSKVSDLIFTFADVGSNLRNAGDKILITINCPVEVKVIANPGSVIEADENGIRDYDQSEYMSSSEGVYECTYGQMLVSRNGSGSSVDNAINLYLDKYVEYVIEIEGAGTGTMDMSVVDEKEILSFTGVSINNATQISCDIDYAMEEDVKLYVDQDGDGEIDEILTPETESREVSYRITFDANGGTVDTETVNTNADNKLEELPEPVRDGYTFKGWFTEPDGGEEVDTDTVFDKNTTLYAQWEEDDDDSRDRHPVMDLIFGDGDGNPFEDVHQSDYFYDAVLWAVGEEVTSGTSETIFSPDMACTRGQMVTFLWRAAGCPNPASYENPFVDVDKDSYYGKAVLWAVHAGITQGTSANTFSPDAQVSRGQMVTFLYRYAGANNDNRTPNFVDVPVGTYYFDAVQWAYDTGFANGMSESTFAPENACTRAQIVTFLYRYFD